MKISLNRLLFSSVFLLSQTIYFNRLFLISGKSIISNSINNRYYKSLSFHNKMSAMDEVNAGINNQYYT